jgi:hypothetical protein
MSEPCSRVIFSGGTKVQILDLICVLYLQLIILSVEGDVPVDSKSLLVTDFVNLNIKSAQSFRGAHRGRVCVCVFIGVSAHMCMSIYVYTVFLKKSDRNLAQCTTPHGIYDLRKQTHTFGTNNWYTLLEGDLPFME